MRAKLLRNEAVPLARVSKTLYHILYNLNTLNKLTSIDKMPQRCFEIA